MMKSSCTSKSGNTCGSSGDCAAAKLQLEALEPRILLSVFGDPGAIEPAGGPQGFHSEVWDGYDYPGALPAGGTTVLVSSVPAYDWYNGCGPTATGMVLGYWDGQGFSGLVDGGAASQTANVNAMITSQKHYEDYSLPLDDIYSGILPDKSSLGGAHADNSVGDWMHTSWSADGLYYGWSYFSLVDDALDGYAAYAGYVGADAWNEAWGDFTWEDFTAEIDGNRPMVFLVDTNADGMTDHFVPAIGYNDSSQQYACYNTWDSDVHWYDFAEMSGGQDWGIYGATFFDPGVAPEAEWTFMVYLDGDNNLEGAGIDDFLEMASTGSDSNVNIVVQFDRIPGYDSSYDDWTDTRRGIIMPGDVPDSSWGVSIGETNVGDPDTLADFATWATTEYPANNYALVLWDHGGGWRSITGSGDWKDVCWDETNGYDYLENREVAQALEAVLPNIDLFGYDACLMSMIECAHEVREEASIFVASEESEPWDGWDYDAIFTGLVASPTMTAEDLGELIAESYYDFYGLYSGVTQSVIDLDVLGDSAPEGLSETLSDLASTIMADGSQLDYLRLQAHRSAAPWYSFGEYIDLGAFLAAVADDSGMTVSISNAASIALAAYNNTVIASFTDPDGGTGLAIYFPEAGMPPDGSYTASIISFAADTQWDEFLGWWEEGPGEQLTFRVVGHAPDGVALGAQSSIRFDFSKPVDASSFAVADDVASFTGPSGDLLGEITGHSWLDANTLEIYFNAQSAGGDYEMVIGPQILDIEGGALDQDNDGTPGEAVDDAYTGGFTIIPATDITADLLDDGVATISSSLAGATEYEIYYFAAEEGDVIEVRLDGGSPGDPLDTAVGVFGPGQWPVYVDSPPEMSYFLRYSRQTSDPASTDPATIELVLLEDGYYVVQVQTDPTASGDDLEGPYELTVMLDHADPSSQAFFLDFSEFDFSSVVTYFGYLEGDAEDLQQVIAGAALARFSDIFSAYDVSATLYEPPGDYSRLQFVDNTDIAYMNNLGVAEEIDVGNLDHTDGASIFFDNFRWGGYEFDSAGDLGTALGTVAAHEAAHLLGLMHVDAQFPAEDLMGEFTSYAALVSPAVLGNNDLAQAGGAGLVVDPNDTSDVYGTQLAGTTLSTVLGEKPAETGGLVVLYTSPAHGAPLVWWDSYLDWDIWEWIITTDIRITFSEGINLSTIDGSSVEVVGEWSLEHYGFLMSYEDSTNTLVLNLIDDWFYIPGERIYITISDDVESIGGDTLGSPYTFSFEITTYTPSSIAVGGTLAEDTVWSSGGVYVVNSTLSVPEGVTLTIQPGVVVKFARGMPVKSLIVQGTLDLLSTPSERIVFTTVTDDLYGGDTNADGATTPLAGSWGAIKYENLDNALHDVIVRYGGNPGSVPAMIWLEDASSGGMEIAGALIEHAYAAGLYLSSTGGAIEISGAVFYNNGQYGVVAGDGESLIEYSTFWKNGIAGLRVMEGAATTAIRNNFPGEIDHYAVIHDMQDDVNAQGNWWGDPSGPGGTGPGSGTKAGAGTDFAPWAASWITGPEAGGVTITSTPTLYGILDKPYAYDNDGEASADGTGPVTWSKIFGPETLSIDPLTGAVAWTPGATGTYAIGIMAEDVAGIDTQVFEVQVDVSGVMLIDDGNLGYSESGSGWLDGAVPGAFDGDYRYHPAGAGANSASWLFSGLDPGYYQVYATWIAHANRASDASFDVYDGASLEAAVPVNQQRTPDDIYTMGQLWESLGVFKIDDGTLMVELDDDANGIVVADAIRLQEVAEAPTEWTLDDWDAGYAETGSGWGTGGLSGAHGADYRYHWNDSGANKASWQFAGLDAGYYEVYATWVPHPNRASNTPFSVYDGGTLEGTLPVNQQQAPDDASAGGSMWESLGAYAVENGTLTVEVSDDADGVVIADAIRLVKLDAAPTEWTSDDLDAGYAEAGTGWATSGHTTGYRSDYRFHSAGSGTNTASWTFAGLETGSYEIFATWQAFPNRASNTPFTIFDGVTDEGTVLVDQRDAPDDAEADGAMWESLGVFDIDNGTLKVLLSDDADGYVIADGIRVVRVA